MYIKHIQNIVLTLSVLLKSKYGVYFWYLQYYYVHKNQLCKIKVIFNMPNM